MIQFREQSTQRSGPPLLGGRHADLQDIRNLFDRHLLQIAHQQHLAVRRRQLRQSGMHSGTSLGPNRLPARTRPTGREALGQSERTTDRKGERLAAPRAGYSFSACECVLHTTCSVASRQAAAARGKRAVRGCGCTPEVFETRRSGSAGRRRRDRSACPAARPCEPQPFAGGGRGAAQ